MVVDEGSIIKDFNITDDGKNWGQTHVYQIIDVCKSISLHGHIQ